MLTAGIDLGGTNMQIGVVDEFATVVGGAKRKTKATEGFDAVIDRLVEGLHEACAEAGCTVLDLDALGIGAPGALDPETGIVLEAVNLCWNDVPLARILSERLSIPVYLDNDVNVAVYGEVRHGAAKGATNAVGLWVGTGIGGGIILGGRLYHGSHKTAGEVGHMILQPGNPRGIRTFENICSRTAIVNRLQSLIRSNADSMLVEIADGNLEKIKSKTLAAAYHQGDALTIEVIDEAAEHIGLVAANAVTLLSLECVILGGGLTEAIGNPFVNRVRESFQKYVFPSELGGVPIVASMLEDDAGIIGAATIANERNEVERNES